MATIITTQTTGEAREGVRGARARHDMSRYVFLLFFYLFFIYSTKYLFAFRITVMMMNSHHWTPSAVVATGAQNATHLKSPGMFFSLLCNFTILITI